MFYLRIAQTWLDGKRQAWMPASVRRRCLASRGRLAVAWVGPVYCGPAYSLDFRCHCAIMRRIERFPSMSAAVPLSQLPQSRSAQIHVLFSGYVGPHTASTVVFVRDGERLM